MTLSVLTQQTKISEESDNQNVPSVKIAISARDTI
jgi:hypothetical protein